MKKQIIITLILSLVLAPVSSWAAPISTDQYGFNGQVYKELGVVQGYIVGSARKNENQHSYFQPLVSKVKKLKTPKILDNTKFAENHLIDVRICLGNNVFAAGKYDSKGNVLVTPVCSNLEVNLHKYIEKTEDGYYQELPVAYDVKITKAYKYVINEDGSKSFVDRPEATELVGRVVKGEFGTKLYTIIANDLEMGLRPITDGYAKLLTGNEDYSSQIVTLDDSVLGSYGIGSAIN